MASTQEILSAARTVQSELDTLLGDKAAEVAPKLAQLINEVEAGQTLDLDLWEFLTEYDATDRRMTELLKETQSEDTIHYNPMGEISHEYIRLGDVSYSPPPGIRRPSSLQKYTCPQCDYTWERRHIGEDIPECPEHKVPLQCHDNHSIPDGT